MRQGILLSIVEVLFLCALYLSGGGVYELFYCGRFQNKPSLPMGMHPTWFASNFQINRGVTSIIESSESFQPKDRWVSGNQLIGVIKAYAYQEDGQSIYIKSHSTSNGEKILKLIEIGGDTTTYEVTIADTKDIGITGSWHAVDRKTCRVGGYFNLTVFLVFVFVSLNFYVLYRIIVRRSRR